MRLFGEQFHRVAENLLSRHKWRFCKDEPKLTGPARQWPPAFVTVMPMLYIWGWTLPVWKQVYLLEGHFDPKDLQ